MKKFLLIFVIFSVLMIVLYCSFLYDTNTVIEDFKDVISNDIKNNIQYGELLDRYNIGEHFEFSNVNIEIRRNFVLHNFKKGIMYINYSYYAYNSSNENVAGSHNIPSKWYIEKHDGRWVVVKIDEKP